MKFNRKSLLEDESYPKLQPKKPTKFKITTNRSNEIKNYIKRNPKLQQTKSKITTNEIKKLLEMKFQHTNYKIQNTK